MNRTGASSNPFTQMVRQSRPNCVSIHLPFSVHVSVCVFYVAVSLGLYVCLYVCVHYACMCAYLCVH